ncbi:MAG: hypothetical protein UFJ18_05915 [Blautia sp.]|nr:hypothetical protein [Blautia sp.]
MNRNFISQTALDQMVSSDRDQMLKAAVPYLPPKGQQILSIYEKARELANTAALFGNPRNDVSICSAQTADPMEALSDIRSFCYGQSRRFLDNVVNMMAVVQMMQLMNTPAESEEDFKT